jgi:hypothetical protein
MIRDLRRPAATQVAVEQIALYRLTKTRRATGVVNFPTRSEIQGAPHRVVDSSGISLRLFLEGFDVSARGNNHLFHFAGFLVNRIQSAHCILLIFVQRVAVYGFAHTA